MYKNEQGQKGDTLHLCSILKTEILKLVIYAKTKPHDNRSCIGNGQRRHGVECQCVWKDINDEPQQKGSDHEQGPVAFYGVPVKEYHIDHWVYVPHKVKIVKDQHLGKDQ